MAHPSNFPEIVHLSPSRAMNRNDRQPSPSSMSPGILTFSDSGSSSQTLAPLSLPPAVSSGSLSMPSIPIHDTPTTYRPEEAISAPPSTSSTYLSLPAPRHFADSSPAGSPDRPKKPLPSRQASPQMPRPNILPDISSETLAGALSSPELGGRRPVYKETSHTSIQIQAPRPTAPHPLSYEILKTMSYNDMVIRHRLVHHDGSVYFCYPYLQTVTKVDYDSQENLEAFIGVRDSLLVAIERMHGVGTFQRQWELHIDVLGQAETSPLWVSLYHGGCLSYPNYRGESVPQEMSCPTIRFWQHLETFPMHNPIYYSEWGALFISALSFGSNERILENKETTFPFTDDQSKRLVEVYSHLLKAYTESTKEIKQVALSSLVWHIARTMKVIQETRDRYKWALLTSYYSFARLGLTGCTARGYKEP